MMAKPTEDDVSELVHHDELAQGIEPQLDDSRRDNDEDTRQSTTNGVPSLGQVNPALEDADVDEQTSQKNIESEEQPSDANIQNGQTQNREPREATVSSPPVYYSSTTGETNVVNEPVVIRQPNGIHVIRTRECCHQQNNYRRERPLKLKHIKFLKGFSILGIILFFPLGILAMYYAFKSEKEFHAGIMQGNIDLARMYAKRSERFIIFSVLGALLVAVMVFAFVERKLMADDEEYWKNRSNAHFVPAG